MALCLWPCVLQIHQTMLEEITAQVSLTLEWSVLQIHQTMLEERPPITAQVSPTLEWSVLQIQQTMLEEITVQVSPTLEWSVLQMHQTMLEEIKCPPPWSGASSDTPNNAGGNQVSPTLEWSVLQIHQTMLEEIKCLPPWSGASSRYTKQCWRKSSVSHPGVERPPDTPNNAGGNQVSPTLEWSVLQMHQTMLEEIKCPPPWSGASSRSTKQCWRKSSVPTLEVIEPAQEEDLEMGLALNGGEISILAGSLH